MLSCVLLFYSEGNHFYQCHYYIFFFGGTFFLELRKKSICLEHLFDLICLRTQESVDTIWLVFNAQKVYWYNIYLYKLHTTEMYHTYKSSYNYRRGRQFLLQGHVS